VVNNTNYEFGQYRISKISLSGKTYSPQYYVPEYERYSVINFNMIVKDAGRQGPAANIVNVS
jgi:hypothetical protein